MLPGSWQIEARFEETIAGKKSIHSKTEETCFTKDVLLSNPLLSPRPETIFDGQRAPCAHAEYQKSTGSATWKQVCILKVNNKDLEIHETAKVTYTANTLLWLGTTTGVMPNGQRLEMRHTIKGKRSGECPAKR
jgi:hypothetical protein